MEITTLPETLQGFFDSLVPAITQSIFFAAFVAFFIGFSMPTALIKSNIARLKPSGTLANDPFIKESGVLKLVPLGLLVAVLLLAIALDRAVSFIGSEIPGKLGYSEPTVLVDAVSTETLSRLWALFPAAEDEHMLYLVLEEQVSDSAPPTKVQMRRQWEYHDDQSFKAEKAISVTKFYVTFGLLLCLARKRLRLETRNVWKRFILVVLVAVALIAYFVRERISAQQQSDWAKVDYIIAKQVASGPESESRLNDKDLQAKFAERPDAYRYRERQYQMYGFFLRP